MKKLLLNFTGIALSTCITATLFAQSTPGTLTFSYTQAAPSIIATQNVYGIWIEDNAGTFIKTKVRFVGSGTDDHLPTWMSKSSGGAASTATAASCSVVDATTGATRSSSTTPTAFGAKTITWNGTDVSGAVVADGTYKIWIESAISYPQPSANTHSYITSFSFSKSTSTVNLTPAGDANFSTITINWVPSTTTGIENSSENQGISVFPNPTNGLLNITYAKANTIEVINTLGIVVYQEKTEDSSAGTKSIDLSNFANGIYLISVSNEIGSSKSRIILNK